MKKLFILKTGTSFPATRAALGDLDHWIARGLATLPIEIVSVDVQRGDPFPALDDCAGIIITGSHAMVTDNEPWSLRLEQWLPKAIAAQLPILGICYGHQLLARAAGGEVNYHPKGKEVGTVTIELLAECGRDPIFRRLQNPLVAHTTHSQSVLRLPEGAVRLAANDHEPHHAFRLGECAWGVQFHPEYNVEIMRAYILEPAPALEAAGFDIPALLDGVVETPAALTLLHGFGEFVVARLDREGV